MGDKHSSDGHLCVSHAIALLMIEEGFAIRAGDSIYQRNPGINYFSYRKWRHTEDYAIKTEGRNKVYALHNGNEKPFAMTREEFVKQTTGGELYMIPPIGNKYNYHQRKHIIHDLNRLYQHFLEVLDTTRHE